MIKSTNTRICETTCFVINDQSKLHAASPAASVVQTLPSILSHLQNFSHHGSEYLVYTMHEDMAMVFLRPHCPILFMWDQRTSVVNRHIALCHDFPGSLGTTYCIAVCYPYRGVSELPPICVVCGYISNIQSEVNTAATQVYHHTFSWYWKIWWIHIFPQFGHDQYPWSDVYECVKTICIYVSTCVCLMN
jgi:hypothetical protein